MTHVAKLRKRLKKTQAKNTAENGLHQFSKPKGVIANRPRKLRLVGWASRVPAHVRTRTKHFDGARCRELSDSRTLVCPVSTATCIYTYVRTLQGLIGLDIGRRLHSKPHLP